MTSGCNIVLHTDTISHVTEDETDASKPDNAAAAKLLDDLFRKTKSQPAIYWIPLTDEQVLIMHYFISPKACQSLKVMACIHAGIAEKQETQGRRSTARASARGTQTGKGKGKGKGKGEGAGRRWRRAARK